MKKQSTFSINGVLKTLFLGLVMLLGAWRAEAQITVTASGGTSPSPTTYAKLQLAINAINTGGHTGVINISVTASTLETVQSTLNSNGTGLASYTAIHIKPAAPATPTISGSFTNALFELLGADSVTIDGSNTTGGTTKDLTFANTNAGGASVIWIGSASTTNGATNNIIKNCNITGGSPTTFGFAILAGGGATVATFAQTSNSNNTIQNNNISNAQTGIEQAGFATTPFDQNWAITGNTFTNLGFIGIFSDNISAFTISNNTVSNISISTNSSISGLELTGGVLNGNVFNNNFSNITNQSRLAAGIYLDATNTTAGVNIYNNFISNIAGGGSATLARNGFGIYADLGGGYNISDNTISLGTNQTGAGVNACIGINGVTTPSSLNIKDNILSNTETSGTPYAIYCTNANTIFASIDYNDYYAPSGSLGFITVGGATTTLPNMVTNFTGNSNSINVAPTFISSTDLHLKQIASNVPFAAGTPITITTDIDGDTRNATIPDIGADETNFVISYTPLANSCTTGDVTLAATIVNAAGINNSTNPPLIYFRKNGGSWFTSIGNLASGTTTNGTWNFTIVAGLIGGLALNDAVQYFVVAQNTAGTIVYSNPSGGFTATSTTAITTFPTSPNSYLVSFLTGTYHIGVGKDYTTITQAVNAYNNSCINGPVTFLLDDANYSTSETFPITINNNSGASAVNTLTIKPNTTTTSTTVTCNSAAAGAFFILGNNVIIDGSNTVGGTSQNLTIKNTNAGGTYVIRIANPTSLIGATNNTIKNCIINNGSGTGATAVILDGSAVTLGGNTEAPNSNCTIQNNTISGAIYGIYYAGCTASLDANVSISGNTISGIGATSILAINMQSSNINANTVNAMIGGFTPDIEGIEINGTLTNVNIFNNKISGVHNTTTGAYGLYLFAFPGSSVNVYNNFIWDIAANGSATPANNGAGIYINQGTGYNIYYNTVDMNTNQTAVAGVPAALMVNTGVATAGAINLKNNIFANTQSSGNTQRYAIYSAAAANVFGTMDYNDYYTASGPNLGFLTAAQSNLTAIQTAFGGNVNSINSAPVFVNATSDLHLQQVGQNTPFVSGTPAPSIATTDINGTTRDNITPVMGAHEVILPHISYTLLPNICASGDAVLTANIVDHTTGISTTAGPSPTGTSPQIYFKKDVGSWFSAPGSLLSGTALNGIWTFTVTAATLGGLLPQDSVSYFVIAQNNSGIIFSKPETGLAAISTTSVTAFPTTPNIYTFDALSGIYHVGAGKAFTTITQAVNAYNGSCLGGAVTFLLDDPTYGSEIYPITINNNATASALNTLTIKPNTGNSVILNPNVAGAGVFYFNGAHYVSIDGSNTLAGTTRNMTITNTNTTVLSYTVRFGSPTSSVGATSCAVKNCAINGGSTNTSLPILSGSGITVNAAAESPNSGDTIQNNAIATGNIGIAVIGGTSPDLNWIIAKNVFTGVTADDMELVNMAGSVFTNTITGVSNNAAFTIDGIFVTGTMPGLNIYGNNITGITNSNTTLPGASYGLELNAVTGTINVYNNFISNIVARGGAAITANAFGIVVDNVCSGINIYHNSVNMSTIESGSAGLTACMFIAATTSGSSLINVKNNIFANTQSGGAAVGSRYAIYNASPSGAGIFASIDNNDYYSAGLTNLGSIVIAGTQTAVTTLANMKTLFGGTASVSVLPVFATPTGSDLHITGSCPSSQLESGGVMINTPITINTDIDGDTRPGPLPITCGGGVAVDIGADEFSGTIADVTAPIITYTPLLSTCSTSSVVLTGVTITDATGIPLTGGNVPRIYFSKNGGAYTSSAGTNISGTATNSVWSFTITPSSTGDVISYFVVAQDLASTPNAGTLPTSSVTPTGVNTVVTTPFAGTPNTYTIGAPLTGTFHVGLAKTYTTITAALAAYNSACLSGPVTFLLDDNTYPTETFPLTAYNPNSSAINTLTIKPNTGAAPVVTGSSTAGILFIKSNNVTIDGSNTAGGTTQNLSFANTNTAGSYVVRIGSPNSLVGATNNTIKNCIVTNGNLTTATYGITVGSGLGVGGNAEAANSNCTIQNNTVSSAAYGIAYAGNTTTPDANTFITGNTGTGLGKTGIYLSYMQSSSVSSNTITAVSSATQADIEGVSVNGMMTNVSILKNYLSNVHSTNTAGGSYGINLNDAAGSSSVNVYNNFIYDVVAPGNGTTVVFNGIGILINQGTGYNIYYNTVNMNTNQTVAGGTPTALLVSSAVNTANTINLKDNILAVTQTAGSTARFSVICFASVSVFASMDYNDYFTNTAATSLAYFNGPANTIGAIQSLTGANARSISVLPTFVSATDMHLSTAAANSALQAGVTISVPPITTDIDGITRTAVPVIGASEVHIPPAITYTLLPSSICSNGDVTLSAVNIQDGLGVPITGTLMPQIYYKKNAGTWTHASGILTAGTAQNGTWSFTISAASLGGFSDGDVVSYYVIAQDAVLGNIASSPSAGLVAADVNTITTQPTTLNTFTIGSPALIGLATSHGVCPNAAPQTVNYAYTNTIGAPTQYTLIWTPLSTTPSATLTSVPTFVALPGVTAGTFSVTVPGGTPAGTFNGTLTVKNTTSSCTNTYSMTLTVNPLPVITFTGQAGATTCASVAVTYTTQTGMTGYTWTYPSAILNTDYSIVSGGTVTSPSVTVKWLKPGSRTVAVNYTDANSCTDLTAVASSATTVLVPPVAIINNAQMCAGGATLTLSDASTGGVWSSTSNSVAPIDANSGIITPGIQGTATITYSNGCGTATQVTATVNALPTSGAGITGNIQMCTVGSNITLSNAATNGVWSSVTTAVATVNAITGVAHPIAQGTTQISYSNNCGSPAIVTATVNATPTAGAGITGNSQICILGPNITLSDAATNGVWASAITTTAVIDPITGIVQPVAQGTSVISYSNGCGSAATITATVNATPTSGAGITGNVQMCTVGSNITLSDAATNGVWTSVTTTVATIVATTGIAHPVAQGTTQISYSNGCGIPAVITATVNATPTAGAGITGNSQICILGPNITLSDAATNGVWASATTTTALVDPATGIVQPVAQGTSVISYSNGCGIAAVVTATVNADPTSGAGITGNVQMCTVGSNITLSDAATNGVWSSVTTTVAIIDPTTGITQPISQGTTQISYSNGCGIPAIVTATVNATPTDGAGITGNSQICILGPNIALSDAATNGVWASATTTTAIVDPATGIVQPIGQGTSLISYFNGCGIAAVVTATVNADPSAGAGITGNAQMCLIGPGITLSNAATNGIWISGTPGTAVISATGVVTPEGQGTTQISYANGCGTAAVVTATVNASPVAIGNNTQICAGGSFITLTDGSTNGIWSGGTSGIATINSTTGVVTSGNTQGTTTFSYSNGCGSATSVTATVNASPAPIAGNTPVCANGTTFTLTNTSTNGTWSGGTPGIATVNSITGVVRSGTTSGTTIISYTNGCSPAATVTVTIDALPAIHTFTGGGAYCAGDPGVPVGLTLTDTGISYQLYRGATVIGSPVNGTGSAISFGIFDTAGSYHVIATNIRSLCTAYLTGITISINPLPDTFTITGGGSYCAAGTGRHIGLDGSATGINYQLYNAGNPVGSPIAGTGGALDFGPQTDSGAYMVIATNAITHCTQNMAGSDTIHIIPLPIADTVTGGGAYCTTDSGVHVGLNASTAGIIYQLYRGITPVGTPDTSTGGAIDFGLHTTGGIYTVIATDPVTTCSSMMTGSVTVTVNPLPRLHTVTGGGSFCAGGPGVHIGLNGSFGGISYQLYTGTTAIGTALPGTGGTLDFGFIAVADTYYVVATNTTTGCIRYMRDSVVVSINPVLVPTVHISTGLGDGDTVCSGVPVAFTAQTTYGGTVPDYMWTVNGTSVIAADSVFNFTPVTGDVISVTLISDTVCAAPDTVSNSITVNVEVRGAPSVFILASPATSIAIGQRDTFTAITTNCGSSPQYQWYKNGVIISGATNMVYTSNTIANHDSISVRVITSGACGGQVTFNSIMMTVFSTGVIQVTQILGDVRLIPNPNNGAFTVKGVLATQTDEEVSIEITDMLGQIVYHNKITARGGIINEQIQLSATLANGMYMLNLLSASDHHVFHFVIEQ